MANTVIAAQLYTVRDFTKTPADVAETFRKLHAMGYRAVQVSGMGPIDPAELKKIADTYEMQICATHISFERMCRETQAVVDEHRLWGCKYAGVGSMPGEYRDSKEGYIRFAKEASVTARKLADQGLGFVYHNHAFEFLKFDGITGLELLYSESEKDVFHAEIDTYWVQAGGGDPADWIRRLKGRMDIIHLKDMVIDEEGRQIMAEVGEGNLNWPAILEACREIGIRWYIVEQDVCRRDPFESLQISLRNLQGMGLK
jgi:sugar phosphate isomerase/epimerase